jgi:hypothetical protein
LFVTNVVALIGLGVAISWWLLEFTDFFPAVGGFLGLGGIFAWAAVVTNLITKDRKEQLQDEIERRVLLGKLTLTFAALTFIGLGFWYTFHGSISIGANGTGQKRVVEIYEGKTRLARIDGIDGSKNRNVPLFVRGFRAVTLRTPGLPELVVKVESRKKTNVIAPQAFMKQPVLLARSSPDVAAIGQGSVQIWLQRGKQPWQRFAQIVPYSGETIWIGAAADTELPASVRERWQRQGYHETTNPTSAGADNLLQVGDRIRVCVMNADGGEAASAAATVLPDNQRVFPQEMQLAISNEMRCSG